MKKRLDFNIDTHTVTSWRTNRDTKQLDLRQISTTRSRSWIYESLLVLDVPNVIPIPSASSFSLGDGKTCHPWRSSDSECWLRDSLVLTPEAVRFEDRAGCPDVCVKRMRWPKGVSWTTSLASAVAAFGFAVYQRCVDSNNKWDLCSAELAELARARAHTHTHTHTNDLSFSHLSLYLHALLWHTRFYLTHLMSKLGTCRH